MVDVRGGRVVGLDLRVSVTVTSQDALVLDRSENRGRRVETTGGQSSGLYGDGWRVARMDELSLRANVSIREAGLVGDHVIAMVIRVSIIMEDIERRCGWPGCMGRDGMRGCRGGGTAGRLLALGVRVRVRDVGNGVSGGHGDRGHRGGRAFLQMLLMENRGRSVQVWKGMVIVTAVVVETITVRPARGVRVVSVRVVGRRMRNWCRVDVGKSYAL
jgi:hypothetical protein